MDKSSSAQRLRSHGEPPSCLKGDSETGPFPPHRLTQIPELLSGKSRSEALRHIYDAGSKNAALQQAPLSRGGGEAVGRRTSSSSCSRPVESMMISFFRSSSMVDL